MFELITFFKTKSWIFFNWQTLYIWILLSSFLYCSLLYRRDKIDITDIIVDYFFTILIKYRSIFFHFVFGSGFELTKFFRRVWVGFELTLSRIFRFALTEIYFIRFEKYRNLSQTPPYFPLIQRLLWSIIIVIPSRIYTIPSKNSLCNWNRREKTKRSVALSPTKNYLFVFWENLEIITIAFVSSEGIPFNSWKNKMYLEVMNVYFCCFLRMINCL